MNQENFENQNKRVNQNMDVTHSNSMNQEKNETHLHPVKKGTKL